MQFEPVEAEDFSPLTLLQPGTYDFSVLKAEEGQSKSGHSRIELLLKVKGKEGQENLVRDWLSVKFVPKIAKFCQAVGLEDVYKEGNLTDAQCVGKKGRVKLDIETGTPKGDGTFYDDKNTVKNYLKGKPKEEGEPLVDDDLPF